MICAITSDGSELRLEGSLRDMFITKLHKKLSELVREGYDEFYTNCEYGVPLWAAEFINSMKNIVPVKLHIVVPYEEHTIYWSEDKRDRYYDAHQLCDTVTFGCTRYQDDAYQICENIMRENSMIYVELSYSDGNVYASTSSHGNSDIVIRSIV